MASQRSGSSSSRPKKAPKKGTKTGGQSARKIIIFIRHGESKWNEAANQGNLNKAIAGFKGFMETMGAKSKGDSHIMDSPLSEAGVLQSAHLKGALAKYRSAREVRHYRKELQAISNVEDTTSIAAVKKHAARTLRGLRVADQPASTGKITREEVINILNGESRMKSVIVSSNLRRAISTVVVALEYRWKRYPEEKLYALSALQEMGIGTDTYTETGYQEVPSVSKYEMSSNFLDGKFLKQFYEERVDGRFNFGDKSLSAESWNVEARLESFMYWVFEMTNAEAVVVGGHSNFFKNMFMHFLPANAPEKVHKFRDRKIRNCGVVAFAVHRRQGDGMDKVVIEPESILIPFNSRS